MNTVLDRPISRDDAFVSVAPSDLPEWSQERYFAVYIWTKHRYIFLRSKDGPPGSFLVLCPSKEMAIRWLRGSSEIFRRPYWHSVLRRLTLPQALRTVRCYKGPVRGARGSVEYNLNGVVIASEGPYNNGDFQYIPL